MRRPKAEVRVSIRVRVGIILVLLGINPPKGGARGRQAERGGDTATAAPKVQKQVAHSAAQAAKIYLHCL